MQQQPASQPARTPVAYQLVTDELVAAYLKSRLGAHKDAAAIAKTLEALQEVNQRERARLNEEVAKGVVVLPQHAASGITERLLYLRTSMEPGSYVRQYEILRDWVHSCLDIFKARRRPGILISAPPSSFDGAPGAPATAAGGAAARVVPHFLALLH